VTDPADDRFAPHASREMAAMFDDVSGRYDLLNRLMTLGRDAHWRAAMAQEVPTDARVVLDLCTGSGVSLTELRQPGRLAIGLDVSLKMLEVAQENEGGSGWAPRLVAGDAFRLPFRDASVDAVTIAFGIRNLRPRLDALHEVARVLRPGGTLVVLEAAAPSPSLFAPLHRIYLERGLPLLGHLSPEPTAYRYLGESILEFGPTETFERMLGEAGFHLQRRRRFMLGASWLWTARASGGEESPVRSGPALQAARSEGGIRGRMRTSGSWREREWRLWTTVQLVVSVGILAVLAIAWRSFHDVRSVLVIEDWQRQAMGFVLVVGVLAFAIRSLVLLGRLLGSRPRR
jgi:demethylmenaquinone methyltransferase/2-methoxy-6-polyprenyl-1,4-benzoquinol methylase